MDVHNIRISPVKVVTEPELENQPAGTYFQPYTRCGVHSLFPQYFS